MFARHVLYAQLAVVILITLIHLNGLEHDLYWRFLWLDTLTHALGGVWAALFLTWIRELLGYKLNFAWGIAGALLLGVFWEVFELIAGIQVEANYPLDTAIDLFMDALGGFLGAFIAVSLKKRDSVSEGVL